MSEFVVVDTCINDVEALQASLAELDIPESQIEVHATPVKLNGYSGAKERKANIIIRREHLCGGYDVGFELKEDGTYRIWMGDYSCDKLTKAIHDKKLLRLYAKHKLLKEVESQYGLRIDSCEEKGEKIEIMIGAD